MSFLSKLIYESNAKSYVDADILNLHILRDWTESPSETPLDGKYKNELSSSI